MDAAGADVGWRRHLGDVDQRGSLEDQSALRSLGSSQTKRKAAVRKQSAETQENESRRKNDLEVGRDEGMEELCFVPSAASDTAGCHTARFTCDKRCK